MPDKKPPAATLDDVVVALAALTAAVNELIVLTRSMDWGQRTRH